MIRPGVGCPRVPLHRGKRRDVPVHGGRAVAAAGAFRVPGGDSSGFVELRTRSVRFDTHGGTVVYCCRM